MFVPVRPRSWSAAADKLDRRPPRRRRASDHPGHRLEQDDHARDIPGTRRTGRSASRNLDAASTVSPSSRAMAPNRKSPRPRGRRRPPRGPARATDGPVPLPAPNACRGSRSHRGPRGPGPCPGVSRAARRSPGSARAAAAARAASGPAAFDRPPTTPRCTAPRPAAARRPKPPPRPARPRRAPRWVRTASRRSHPAPISAAAPWPGLNHPATASARSAQDRPSWRRPLSCQNRHSAATKPQGHVGMSPCDGPVQRGAEVGVFRLELLQPLPARPKRQLRCCGLGQAPGRSRRADGVTSRLTRGAQLVGGELPDRLEHARTGFPKRRRRP